MAVTVEYREGIFYIVHSPTAKERALFPKDGQLQSTPVAMGFDYDTGDFVPLSVTADGKIKVDGTL
jgi:hypothetical protein